MANFWYATTALAFALLAPSTAWTDGQTTSPAGPAAVTPELVLIDTDIGDDIDDAFAVSLALASPEIRVLGITTTYGDTTLRARLLDRFLAETGHGDVPVGVGPATPHGSVFTQARYAERALPIAHGARSAVDLLRQQIQAHPKQISLIAIGPLTTVEAMLDHDPATFRLLRRVVMMGGSIDRGNDAPYPDPPGLLPHGATPEWNIVNGIGGARKLLASGVPIVMMPLDSTQLPLDDLRRGAIFAHGSPITDALTLLYHQWGGGTPILFDPLTIAYVVNPALCPSQPLRLRVDDKGYTRREPGPPNVQVCLRSDREGFFSLLMNRLLRTDAARKP